MTDTAEEAAVILGFIADHPGVFGRVRAGKIITGTITEDDVDRAPTIPAGGILPDESLADVVALIDALLDGGLAARTYGDRPRLVLTRAGWRALDAIEQYEAEGSPR